MTEEELVDAYRAGTPVVMLAREAGCDPATVHRRLRRAGVPARGKPGARKVDVDSGWLAERVAEGWPTERIAGELGASRSVVLWHLSGLGLWQPPAEQQDKAGRAARMYADGWSLRDVAVAVGVDRHTVTLWFRSAGVQIRRRGRPGVNE